MTLDEHAYLAALRTGDGAEQAECLRALGYDDDWLRELRQVAQPPEELNRRIRAGARADRQLELNMAMARALDANTRRVDEEINRLRSAT